MADDHISGPLLVGQPPPGEARSSWHLIRQVHFRFQGFGAPQHRLPVVHDAAVGPHLGQDLDCVVTVDPGHGILKMFRREDEVVVGWKFHVAVGWSSADLWFC